MGNQKKLLIKKGIMFIMLFLCSLSSIAQATLQPYDPTTGGVRNPPTSVGDNTARNDDYYAKAIDFMQGEGVLETWFTEGFMPLYDNFMKAEYGSYILFGQALACVGAMLYLGYIGWQMISGDKEWEILPMLKPFAIGMVIMNWTLFVDVIKTPLVTLQQAAHEDFNESQQELTALRMVRYKRQQQVVDRLIEEQAKAHAEVEQQNAGNKTLIEEGLDVLGDGLTSLLSPVYELYLRLQIDFQLVVSAVLETIGLWILRICTYLIFFIQVIFSTILIIVGPIAVGISVIPMFSSSFGNWVAKFININLYGFIAFIVLKIGTLLQKFAFTAEIDRYEQMVNTDGTIKNMDLLLTFSSGGIMSFGLVIVCFVISGIGVLCVPTLANYIVTTGSNASAMSKMKKAGMAVATGGKSLIFKK